MGYWKQSNMHSRRVASLLIGAALAISVLTDFMAIQNFRSVDRFLDEARPPAAADIRALGPGTARILLRSHVGEINRFLFEKSEQFQLVLILGFIAAVYLGQGSKPRIILTLGFAVLAILLVDRFYLTPEITRLGRELDDSGSPAQNAGAFWQLHGIYSGLELVKLAVGFSAAVILAASPGQKRSSEANIPAAAAASQRG